MKLNLVCAARICAMLLIAYGACQSVPAAEAIRRTESTPAGWRTVDLIQTNHSARIVTNVIEVRVPNNAFVTEYRTNSFDRVLTNVVNVVVTNWSQKTVTNTMVVNHVRTNIVDQFQTNWTTVAVTNRAIFNLTNLETVVVAKTNWVRQPVTNFVEVNVPVKTVVIAKEETPRAASQIEAPPAETNTASVDKLVMEAVKTARPYSNEGIEVAFKARLASDTSAALEVSNWLVERDDGAVLFSAQTQEFSRRVPPGRYSIEIKARRSPGSPLLSLKSTLDVTRDAIARR